MTKSTRAAKMTAAAITLTAALFIAAPAHADGYQKDVETCRTAMTAQSHINMNDYRLRFERSQGNRVRTVYLKAIPKKGGQSFRFTCDLNRTQVVALNGHGQYTKLAWSKPKN